MATTPRNVLTSYLDPVLGVTVTVYKPRKAPAVKMGGKNSRGYVVGSSGFATGFPRKSALGGQTND
jgi:hypothetical protein